MRARRVAVIGGGHNGLVCAFYLARAGCSVQVFERRGVVGGAAVTEEFHPGFRNSTASYTVSLLHPRIIDDMALQTRHGLRILERPVSNFVPLQDGRYLKLGPTLAQTQAEVAKFSARDAQQLPAYYEMLDGIGDLLRDLAIEAPPELTAAARSLPRGLRAGRSLRALSLEQRRDLLALFTQSGRQFLDAWFECDPIKAALGFDSVVGNFASPDSPGSAYVLLHHTFGGVNGKKGQWGHAVGGMGAITQAMAQACREAGVTIRLDSPVRQVLVAGERDNASVRGLLLGSGREIEAGIVVANCNPKLLYRDLLPAQTLAPEFLRRIERYRCGSGTLRMNVALSEAPRFSALPEPGEHLASGILIAPSLDYMDRAYLDARADGWSREPVVEMLIPSMVDGSLAPAGCHVASLFCQQFAWDLPAGQSWDDARETVADLVIDTVDRYAPGFKRSVLGRLTLTPLDLERRFGLVGGDIMHGHMALDQLWAARPMLGHGDYRGPISGLYMCGAGTHPGGGVSGLPGHNAAREVLRGGSLWMAARLALGGH
jgi:phytoene dehydrogenase-like protein